MTGPGASTHPGRPAGEESGRGDGGGARTDAVAASRWCSPSPRLVDVAGLAERAPLRTASRAARRSPCSVEARSASRRRSGEKPSSAGGEAKKKREVRSRRRGCGAFRPTRQHTDVEVFDSRLWTASRGPMVPAHGVVAVARRGPHALRSEKRPRARGDTRVARPTHRSRSARSYHRGGKNKNRQGLKSKSAGVQERIICCIRAERRQKMLDHRKEKEKYSVLLQR